MPHTETILHRVWTSFTRAANNETIGIAQAGSFVNSYMHNAVRDQAAMDGAARALYLESGATVPYRDLSAEARGELRREAQAVIKSLIAFETVELERVVGNRWAATRHRRNGRSQTTHIVAADMKTASATVVRLFPNAVRRPK